MSEPTYPECEKMHAVHDKSQIIGEFVDVFLESKGIILAEWTREMDCGWESWTMVDGLAKLRCVDGDLFDIDGDFSGVCEMCDGTGVVKRDHPVLDPTRSRIVDLLAEFFEINLDKVEAERRQMLESLRG